MIKVTRRARHVLILIFLSYALFMLGNSLLSLTNPDEVFYSQTAKEMISHHSWLTPYLFDKPQFEKPIFLYWLMRVGFIIFGIGSFGARFFPALFAVFGVIAVYFLTGLGFKDDKKAFMSALILMSAGFYVGMARTVFTDMIFTVFILLSLLSFFWGYVCREKRTPGLMLFFIFSGLAILTKGPIGFFIPALTIILFLLIKKDLKFLLCRCTFWGFIVFLGISLPWYIVMIQKYGREFTNEFFYNDHFRRIAEAEHRKYDTWYYYPFSMIAYMFPWSLFTLTAIVYFVRNLKRGFKDIHAFLACWIFAVLCVFQPAHSKLSSYILPLFPALGIITGDFLWDTSTLKPGSIKKVFVSLGVFFSAILIPVGLVILGNKHAYAQYKTQISILTAVYAGLVLLSLVFILRKSFLKNIYILVAAIFIFLWSALLLHNYIDPYASSRLTSDYLVKNYKPEGYILCSKPFVRGVRYYTDKQVAVVNIHSSQDNFFSPHPIPYLHTGEELREFLKKQAVTYCILKKSSVDEIKDLAGKEFNFTLLKAIKDQYIFVVSFNRNV